MVVELQVGAEAQRRSLRAGGTSLPSSLPGLKGRCCLHCSPQALPPLLPPACLFLPTAPQVTLRRWSCLCRPQRWFCLQPWSVRSSGSWALRGTSGSVGPASGTNSALWSLRNLTIGVPGLVRSSCFPVSVVHAVGPF